MRVLTALQREYLKSELADRVGRDHVLADEADRIIYGVDYFWVPRMLVDRGRVPPIPDFVVLPANPDEVSTIVKLANIHRIPVIPWGGGSGSQGGVMPVYGGITVDLKRLGRIIEINRSAQTVTAEAGVCCYDLECALNSEGYTLGHIPASIHSATLGGSIACRGSGVLSTRYGKIEDMVLSLQVVLPSGAVVRTLPVPNHAAGPGLLQVFVGAEGTYGIITEATCRIERLPAERRFLAFLLPTVSQGFETCRRIMLARLAPSVMRLYDEAESRKQITKILGLELEHGAYLVVGHEGDPPILDLLQAAARRICEEQGGRELSADHAWSWWDHRYNFYFPPHTLDFPWMFGTMDTLATFDKIEKLYWTKRERLERSFAEWGLEYMAHMSHWYPWGGMIYDRFVIQEPPQDPDQALALHNEVWNMAVRTSIECGGVLNEHHGVGLKLSRLIREQYGEAFQVLEALKRGLDPHGVLNPGKMGFGPTA